MKRIVLWLMSTLSAVVLLFGYHTSTSGPAATAQAPVGASLSTRSVAAASGGGGGTGGGTSTVTGDVAQTRWGPVQVQLTLDTSGTITDVEVLQYPSGSHEDQQINSFALPRLVQETLDAQSAHVDMVSGATVTSQGYLTSLQSALDQASA
ncbi:FMN-binding protein [Nocardioides anomalus]|uniref:FMN-binding protein n=1 Tax=Nocardioides anomalus TaxID=2712223 RepID=A0A6G6WC68_9ACTN|nr:FMN-binding protein [Nocardioides anomalus]QIG42941.1 FMN-binding protein [Nocardioides anomalus]